MTPLWTSSGCCPGRGFLKLAMPPCALRLPPPDGPHIVGCGAGRTGRDRFCHFFCFWPRLRRTTATTRKTWSERANKRKRYMYSLCTLCFYVQGGPSQMTTFLFRITIAKQNICSWNFIHVFPTFGEFFWFKKFQNLSIIPSSRAF